MLLRKRFHKRNRLLSREVAGYVCLACIGMAALAALCGYLTSSGITEEFGEGSPPEIVKRGLSGVTTEVCQEVKERYAGHQVLMVFVYLALTLYIFIGIAILCDDFFVASLEVISEKLDLSEDVAGATFMAAGSSAPELFTSVADAFATNNSIGVGTIVGSAMFNILVIVALSAAVVKNTLKIDWRPVARDVCFYVASIGLLALFFRDGLMQWYESLAMVGLYALYIVFMVFNQRVFSACASKISPEDDGAVKSTASQIAEDNTVSLALTVKIPPNSGDETFAKPDNGVVLTPITEKDSSVPSSENDEDMVKPFNNPEKSNPVVKELTLPEEHTHTRTRSDSQDGRERYSARNTRALSKRLSRECVVSLDESKQLEAGAEDDDDESPFSKPEGAGATAMWIVSLPFLVAFYFTIPNCQTPRWEKWYVVSFLTSILWIGVLCWAMAVFATDVGCLLDIDPPVMGILLLAAGTSVPDAIGSIVVAKHGEGDMAIANAIGSNVFDILLGLGSPWFAYALIYGEPFPVNNEGISLAVGILLGTVILFVIVLSLNKWLMHKQLGYCLLALYVMYIIWTLLTSYCVIPVGADC